MRIPYILCAACAFSQTLTVTTTLVQVDAVVTTRSGQAVTNLTRDDFEVLEDGHPREIRSFAFVPLRAPVAPAAVPGTQTRPVSTAPQILQRQDVRRTVAIVVDDLKMSVQSLHYTREALKKFLATQIAPGDLVAILTTSGTARTLGTFTTDTAQMRAAINQIRANLTGGGPADAVKAIGGGEGDDAQVRALLLRQFAVGTLNTVRHIAEGMRDMPGRKSVVLFSEGMRMSKDFAKEEPPVDVNEVRRVSDAANRSSVVIHAIDPRGVVYPGLQAKDDVSNLETVEVRDQIGDRLETLRGTQATLRFLAAETGGRALVNSNDMNDSLRQILDNEAGYYLLGFQPGEADAKRLQREGKYHRLQVRLKRKELVVRHRKGFLGDTAAPPAVPRTPAERLMAAIASPFATSGLPLRLNPVFALGERNQPVIRALLHIGGDQVEFGEPDAKGIRTATIHILATTEGETRAATEKTFHIRVAQDAVERQAKGGFVYSLEHEIKKSGPYQMRVAILDAVSGRTGSASRFVEVPDTAKGQLAISGITMAQGDLREGREQADEFSPAVREFVRGRMFSYGLTVYNAPANPTSGQPSVELQPRLISGDKVVWEGKRIPVVTRPGLDARKLPAGGVLTLSEKTPPGEYLLELQAISTTGKAAQLSQWTTFTLQ